MPWKHSCHCQTCTVTFKVSIFHILHYVHQPILIWCNILDSILLVFYTHVGVLVLAVSAVPWLPQSPTHMLCCLSSYPDNKLHQSWPCLLLNPANTCFGGLQHPLNQACSWCLYLGPVSLPGMIILISVLLLTAEIFSPSQPSFSHSGLKLAWADGPGPFTLPQSKRANFSAVLAWLHKSSWLQCFSCPFPSDKEEA